MAFAELSASLQKRINDAAVALKQDIDRAAGMIRVDSNVAKARQQRSTEQVQQQEIILKQLREEREALLRVYETALAGRDEDLNEEVFWARVAQVDSEIAAAASLIDSHKISVHLPVEQGSLFVGGSNGVYFGTDHVWMDTVEADLAVKVTCLHAGSVGRLEAPGLQVRLSSAKLSLLLQGVKIRTDKGKRIPDMDIKSLHLEACVEATVPLVFQPHIAVQQHLLGSASATSPSSSTSAAAGAVQEATGTAVSGRYGRWCVGDDFSFSVNRLKTRQVGGGLFALPSGITQWIVNMLLPGAVKKAALDAVPPELGDMLCLGQQDASLGVHVAVSGIPRCVAAAQLGEAARGAELPPAPPLLEACLPPPLLPHQDSPLSRRRMQQMLFGVGDQEAVPPELLQAALQQCKHVPCTPLTEWAGMPPVGCSGRHPASCQTCVQPNTLLSCGPVDDTAQHAATAAYWLGMTPLQAQHWSSTFQHAKLASLNLCSMHGIIDFARAHRPWLLQLLPDVETSLLQDHASGTAHAAAASIAQYPKRLAQGIMQWVSLLHACQGMLDDQLQLGVLSASTQDEEDQLRRAQAAQGTAQASAVDARIVFTRALALAGLPVAVQCSVHSLHVEARLLHAVRLGHQVALRALQEQQAAVLKKRAKKTSVRHGALDAAALALLDHARVHAPAQIHAVDVSATTAQRGAGEEKSTSFFHKAKSRMRGLRGKGGEGRSASASSPSSPSCPPHGQQPLVATPDAASNPFSHAQGGGTTTVSPAGPSHRRVALAAQEGGTPPATGQEGGPAAPAPPRLLLSPAPRARTDSVSTAGSSPVATPQSSSDRREVMNLQRSVDALHASTALVLSALQQLPLILKKASTVLRLDVLGGGLASSAHEGTVEARLEHLQAELAGGGRFAQQVLDQAFTSQPTIQSRVRNNHTEQRIEMDLLLPTAGSAAGAGADSPAPRAPAAVAATVALQQLWMGLLLDTAAMAANGCIGGTVNIAEVSFLGPMAPGFGLPVQGSGLQRPEHAVASAAACPWLYPALDVKHASVSVYLHAVISFLRDSMLLRQATGTALADSPMANSQLADSPMPSSQLAGEGCGAADGHAPAEELDHSSEDDGPIEQLLSLAQKYLRQSALAVRSHLAVSLQVQQVQGAGTTPQAAPATEESVLQVVDSSMLPDFGSVQQDTVISVTGSASEHAQRMLSAHVFKPIARVQETSEARGTGGIASETSSVQDGSLARGWGRPRGAAGSTSESGGAADAEDTPITDDTAQPKAVVGAHIRVNLFALAADLGSLSRG